MVDSETGFLGRWARRKTDILQGKPVVDPQVQPVVAPAVVVIAREDSAVPSTSPNVVPAAADTHSPALSLDDVRLLTKESDFAPYVVRGVDAGVRNAAMKKLFADPHFNVMDGLDIYIDDYSISDPIPQAMLRQMTGSKLLNLFDDDSDNHDNTDTSGAQISRPAPEPALDSESTVLTLDDDVSINEVTPADARPLTAKTNATSTPSDSGVNPLSDIPRPP